MAMRLATLSDVPALRQLMERSIMIGMEKELSEEQRKASIDTLFGVDHLIIRDGTYFLIEKDGKVIASGGWSFRRTLFGSDAVTGRDDSEADPTLDDAPIRALYVDPDAEGSGLGRSLVLESEMHAQKRGFRGMAIGATLTGTGFYKQLGYTEVESVPYTLPNGLVIPLVKMRKSFDT